MVCALDFGAFDSEADADGEIMVEVSAWLETDGRSKLLL